MLTVELISLVYLYFDCLPLFTGTLLQEVNGRKHFSHSSESILRTIPFRAGSLFDLVKLWKVIKLEFLVIAKYLFF